MTPLVRFMIAAGCAAGASGCATPPSGTPLDGGPSALATPVAAERATEAVVAGRSTKADVAAALGKALAVRFHSGFEVWVYRIAAAAPAARAPAAPAARDRRAELVILFAPSGIAAKTRIRPAP